MPSTKVKKRTVNPSITAVEAVRGSERFLRNFYSDESIEGLRVEGVELNPNYLKEGIWAVILSFVPAKSTLDERISEFGLSRMYKEFWVDSTDGTVTRMGDPIDAE